MKLKSFFEDISEISEASKFEKDISQDSKTPLLNKTGGHKFFGFFREHRSVRPGELIVYF